MNKKKKSPFTPIILVGLLGVVVLLGIGFWYYPSDESSVAGPVDDISAIFPDDITKGNPQGKAVLIEYGDFQCEACKSMHERFRLIWRVVQDDLHLVYRHYPLPQHAYARMAARYSEAMKLQDKFWPFHDLVYDHQFDWQDMSSTDAETMFQEFVIEAGGDLEQVKQDLQSPAIDKKIDRDIDMGNRSDLLGTPTLILNGNKINIPTDLSKFVSQIKQLNP